ncbi:MAG TPA: DUF6691 family protein [Polyangia bacterium]
MKLAVAFFSALLFAIGLGIAGMTNPAKVIGFLDVTGRWDPSLAFVMAGALLVHLPFVQWWQRRSGAARAQPARGIDTRVLIGAAIFGVGWGLSGLCPGPAFVSLARANLDIFVFVAALFVGSALAGRWSGANSRTGPT